MLLLLFNDDDNVSLFKESQLNKFRGLGLIIVVFNGSIGFAPEAKRFTFFRRFNLKPLKMLKIM